MKKRVLPVMAVLVVIALFCGHWALVFAKEQVEEPKSYLTAIPYGQGFLAAGTNGTLDYIDTSEQVLPIETKTKKTIRDIAAVDGIAVAVGDSGMALRLDSENQVSPLSLGTENTLIAVTPFQNKWLIAEEKTVYLSDDLQTWKKTQPPVEGIIRGLAANDSYCVGVTDRGESVRSQDGLNWEVLNYNDYYGDSVSFDGICCCGGVFYAFGVDADGFGRVFQSVMGGVWADCALETADGYRDPELRVRDIAWDGEQAVAGCTGGKLFTMPSCSKCNKQQQVGEKDWNAAAFNDGWYLFAGEDFRLMDKNQIRQSNIKAEAALRMQENGAAVIDVRSREDYRKEHIQGSFSIPLDELAAELPRLHPDKTQTVIFYCSAGVRSQSALEQAIGLGYESVYNLGAMSDWPYGFESEDHSGQQD